MTAETRDAPRFDRVAAIVGILLLILAGLLVWDANSLTLATPYGLGPTAMPYLVAGGLVLLGAGHIIAAVRSAPAEVESADAGAVLWITGGLVALIATIWVGGGFIVATAFLFAATARAFGRQALAVDLAIGFGLGFFVYLAFTKLLTLSLPQGPLERLL
jgi:putative tricarboxylic transport membrane protein